MKTNESEVLFPYRGWVRHLAPIPLLYRTIDVVDLSQFNSDLLAAARKAFSKEILEVPDERHLHDLGSVPPFPSVAWREPQRPAVGVWHRVPKNSFLNLDNPAVNRLRAIVLESHRHLVEIVGEEDYRGSELMENWIQLYQQGDYKVLHNHERYQTPFITNMWVGVYYIQDGEPDYDKKYSGLISFSIRGCNYLVRPKPGLLMIWPSDILHEVHAFYGKRERVVVNFHVRNVN